MADSTISREGITAADRLIRPYIRRTPVIEIDGTDIGLGPIPIRLKLEQLQHSGSFKARGAFANLLMREIPPNGVVAASGGNHGAAVAYAAKTLGVPAKIFVPNIASPAKIQRIRDYGADLVVGGERYADALAASERWAAQSGALSVHAFDQDETLLGQGTIGLELAQQTPELDTLLVAVGGGGLIGGIAAWYAGALRVIGVEPEAAPTLTRALEAGRPVDAEAGGIAANSLAPRRIGERVFPIARDHVDRVVLVSRCGDPPSTSIALDERADRCRARRGRRVRGARLRPLSTGAGRACRRPGERRQYDRSRFRAVGWVERLRDPTPWSTQRDRARARARATGPARRGPGSSEPAAGPAAAEPSRRRIAPRRPPPPPERQSGRTATADREWRGVGSREELDPTYDATVLARRRRA